eukprot:SAG11_NODE_70_length_18450_cov_14.704975_13_plen_57_part_00
MRRQVRARQGRLWRQTRGGTEGAKLGWCRCWVERGQVEAAHYVVALSAHWLPLGQQ